MAGGPVEHGHLAVVGEDVEGVEVAVADDSQFRVGAGSGEPFEGEAWEGSEGAQSAESAEQWGPVGVVHDAPCAAARGASEVRRSDGWGWVAPFGDGCLEGGLPRGEICVGVEAEHDSVGQSCACRGVEGERPHLGPEAAAQPRWRRVEPQFGEVELSTEVVDDGVEFGGWLTVGVRAAAQGGKGGALRRVPSSAVGADRPPPGALLLAGSDP